MGGLWGDFGWATFIMIGAQGFWAWGLSLSLKWGTCTMDAPILTPVAFDGTGSFSSGITLHCNINLFWQYLTPSGLDITYDLGVFSSGVNITVAGCHRLTLGTFCSHNSNLGRNSGSSLAWASCPAYSCLLERLFHCCRSSGDCW